MLIIENEFPSFEIHFCQEFFVNLFQAHFFDFKILIIIKCDFPNHVNVFLIISKEPLLKDHQFISCILPIY
jgi:hypothetical protein